ncbi:MAG TPA: cobalamin-binding protein [Casimicrobiaceae bacterium]|jgi:iron complex transport system substrate-binding protein
MTAPRIVSFLPAATEMACALGLADQIIGVSHECDYPHGMREKPVVVRNALDLAQLAPSEIDRVVSTTVGEGNNLYAVDEPLLRSLAPDIILTQDLCQVCAPSGSDVTRVIGSLRPSPDVLYFTPRTMADVDSDLQMLGDATGRRAEADAIIASNRARLESVAAKLQHIRHRPRVFFAEWVDPIFCAGHWVPEMIALAGGDDPLGRSGSDSVRVSWDDVVASAPEVIIIAPCGYSMAAALEQVELFASKPEWSTLPAVQDGRVFAVDANSYFARPAPRLVDGVELLAHLFHPSETAWCGAAGAWSPARSRR